MGVKKKAVTARVAPVDPRGRKPATKDQVEQFLAHTDGKGTTEGYPVGVVFDGANFWQSGTETIDPVTNGPIIIESEPKNEGNADDK